MEVWTLPIASNILLGKNISITDNKAERLKTMILVALGQKKMFTRPIPALLHLCLYAAFVITQIELIEIIFDGLTYHSSSSPKNTKERIVLNINWI